MFNAFGALQMHLDCAIKCISLVIDSACTRQILKSDHWIDWDKTASFYCGAANSSCIAPSATSVCVKATRHTRSIIARLEDFRIHKDFRVLEPYSRSRCLNLIICTQHPPRRETKKHIKTSRLIVCCPPCRRVAVVFRVSLVLTMR